MDEKSSCGKRTLVRMRPQQPREAVKRKAIAAIQYGEGPMLDQFRRENGDLFSFGMAQCGYDHTCFTG
jgi:hypothetical protein